MTRFVFVCIGENNVKTSIWNNPERTGFQHLTFQEVSIPAEWTDFSQCGLKKEILL